MRGQSGNGAHHHGQQQDEGRERAQAQQAGEAQGGTGTQNQQRDAGLHVVHRQLEALQLVLRNLQGALHIRQAAQGIGLALACGDLVFEASGRLSAAAKGAHQWLRRHLVLHDGVDTLDHLANAIDAVHRCAELSLRWVGEQRQQQQRQQRQGPAQDEQGDHHHGELQQRLQPPLEELACHLRER